ncbi:MAG: hypothetical protein JWQ35_21 [Bacteriovoracaceae bacterium]|nr:hypothetical protein [Bacteriovoracaceae bacterium]
MNSPFYNQAETHTFSDWLVPYVLGVGVEDLEEYYLGGLPDLSSFLERDGESFKINFEVFRELTENHLTAFGKQLRAAINGKTFIDLGCGISSRSIVPRLLAQAFSAKAYIGVDLLNVSNEIRENEFLEWGPFKSQFIKEDILTFLKSSKREAPSVYFLAGLELEKNVPSSDQYIKDLSSELTRLTSPKDFIILGAGTVDLKLNKKEFKLVYSDQYQEMFQRKSNWFW